MVLVAISGYFDPIHVGHLEYIRLAKELGDDLFVIVNNDNQAKLKKGKSFMNEKDRVTILSNIKGVDAVFLSIDQDRTVCKTLEMIKPDIFANGGDQNNETCAEKETCERLGIKMIDGLGEKIRSSRDYHNI